MSLIPRIGIAVVAALGVGSIFFLIILDAVLDRNGSATIGERLVTWTKKNPWFSAILTLILGVLLSHFFWPGG